MSGLDFRIGLLKSYSYLSGYIEQADFNIFNKALGTHNFGCRVKEDTKIQVESIIKLINQKNQLVKLFNALTRTLNAVEEKDRKLLLWRYVKKKDAGLVMQKMKLSKGAYYSHLRKALSQVEAHLKKEEIDENWFFENYSTKAWFRRLIDFAFESGCH